MRRWAAAIPLLLTVARLEASAVLSLRLSATARGPNVLLGDVLDGVSGPAALLPVKPSGMPGGSVEVPAALVALKLRRLSGGPWHLSGAAACSVSVPAQLLPGATLVEFVRDYLKERLSGTADAELKPLGAVADLRLYDAPVRLRCDPVESDALRGNVVLRVQVLQDGPDGREREAASVPVSFLVKRSEPQVVSTKTIRKGETLGAENLELRLVDTTYESRGFSSLEAVEGKLARGYIGAGKVVTRSMVEFPPLIRRGDVVKVLVRSKTVLVETSAEALRDAREGESLPVRLLETRKHIQARCVEAGLVVYEAR